MEKFTLAFGIHNHQPVGNFEAVFEDAHRQAYLPFIKLLASFEDISISLHQSGILWNWQKKAHPEYFEMVGKLIDSGQLELMTGGFYEPVLTSIPARDARGQIEMLNQFIQDHFEVTPDGLWLTERIWEPHLPKLLAEAGVRYLPIDDTHFIYSGFNRRKLKGPFVTEDEGRSIVLLPISKRLRYLIPFRLVEEVIDELKRLAEKEPDGMVIYADDGEKFGIWPNTHKHCWEEGWMERFFEAIADNADWLQVVPLGEAAKADPIGRAYLPSASYEEMLHWSLPSDAFREYEQFEQWLAQSGQDKRFGRFVRGGHWRGFLTKYEESNLMHKKMLWVSDELAEFESEHPERTDETRVVRDRLYASQCNCPYWHGIFGGLYLPHIRQAIYSSMIEAHARLRKLRNEEPWQLFPTDYDRDGLSEIVYDSDELTAVVKPSHGGMLIDLSLNQHHFDLTDTLTRRKEGYHLKLDQAVLADSEDSNASIHDLILTKEEGLSDYLIEDWYLKRCFIDHFFMPDVQPDTLASVRFGDEGDFVLEPYGCRMDSSEKRVVLTRDGHIWRSEGKYPVRVVKEFKFEPKGGTIEVRYELSSNAPGGVEVNFAIENNFNFQAGHAEDRFVMIDNHRREDAFLDSISQVEQARAVALVDQFRSLAVAVCSDRPVDIWHLPIYTVSLSEGGFEKVFQGTTVIHHYCMQLTEEPCRISLFLHAGSMKEVLERAFQLAAVSR